MFKVNNKDNRMRTEANEPTQNCFIRSQIWKKSLKTLNHHKLINVKYQTLLSWVAI